MVRETTSLTIVFADISGSTRLYETLGDAIARSIVADCLAVMGERVRRHGGTVIKTIGDEVMCTFPTADQAVDGAMGIQEAVTDELPIRNRATPPALTVRIGLHHGSAILEAGDVFGDAVNVAARMAGIAKGGQVITTEETVAALSPAYRTATRHLDRMPVKGKAEDIDIFEVIWLADDVTRMATGLLSGEARSTRLHLRYGDRTVELDQDMTLLVLGRGKNADMVINDSMASREHARIECRRGKFILTDMSTNGTFVLAEDGRHYLRREEIVLTGEGKIALGRDLEEATEVVSFSCD